jgi:hypothetical protein
VQAAQAAGPKPVSDHAVKAAKMAIEDTLSAQARGDVAKAIKSLKKAHRLNPGLISDTFFVSLATSLLNCDEADVSAALQDQTRAAEVVKSSDDQKTQASLAAHIEEVTNFRWTAVGLDVAIFGLIFALAPVLLTVILGESLRNWMILVSNDEAAPNEVLLDLAEFVGALDLRSLVVLSMTLLVSGLLSLLVQCIAIHLSATRYLGGTGTLRYLMYKLISYFNRYMLTVFVVTFISIWLFISNGFVVGLLPVGGILALFSLLKFVKVGDRIGEAYKFSSGGGCVSVLVASIVLVVANGAIAYLVYLVLGSVLAQILPPLPQ